MVALIGGGAGAGTVAETVSATVAFGVTAWLSAGAGFEGVDAVVFVGGVTAATIEAHRCP
jgi:hypothetical protein